MAGTTRGHKIAILLCCAAVIGGIVALWVCRSNLRVWYVLRQRFEVIGRNTQGYLEYRHRETGILFVRLPSGRFLMGSPEGEYGAEKCETPRHEVVLDSFLMAKYEVNQKEWGRHAGQTPSRFRGQDLPVEMVSWFDCIEFSNKHGFNLPTEAQWEYACRGNTGTPFALGSSISPDLVNYSGKDAPDQPSKGVYREQTVPVGAFAPNGFGLHNMHGNVAEWCKDAMDWEFYSKPAARDRNPVCSEGQKVTAGCYTPEDAPPYRVARGGDFSHWAIGVRSAKRMAIIPGARINHVGFRPVFNLTGLR